MNSVNPLEAGLGFAVKFGKGEFIGRDALLKIQGEGLRRRLVGFEMIDRGVPRAEFMVAVDERIVGYVTSGTFAPSLEKSVGMAYVESALATVGQEIDIVIRDKPTRAVVVKMPFYRSKSRATPVGTTSS